MDRRLLALCARRASATLRIPPPLREETRRPSRTPPRLHRDAVRSPGSPPDGARRRGSVPAPRSAKVTLHRVLITWAKSTRRRRTTPSIARSGPLRTSSATAACRCEASRGLGSEAMRLPSPATPSAPRRPFLPRLPAHCKKRPLQALNMAALTMFPNASSRPV